MHASEQQQQGVTVIVIKYRVQVGKSVYGQLCNGVWRNVLHSAILACELDKGQQKSFHNTWDMTRLLPKLISLHVAHTHHVLLCNRQQEHSAEITSSAAVVALPNGTGVLRVH